MTRGRYASKRQKKKRFNDKLWLNVASVWQRDVNGLDSMSIVVEKRPIPFIQQTSQRKGQPKFGHEQFEMEDNTSK